MAFDTGTLTNVAFYVSFAIIFSLLALGFNLQWGYTGLFNAGIAGFFLIGAYAAAFAITAPAPAVFVGGIKVDPGHVGGFSQPFVVGALLAMVASGLAAALIAIPTLRLRADYLAIATLAFAEIIRVFAINLESVTGGTIGIVRIPRLIDLQPPNPFANAMVLVAVGAVVLLAVLVALNFMAEAPWGRVLRAIREDEVTTMSLGKNTFLFKLQAFALGGALIGLAGALFTISLSYVEPGLSFAPAVTFSVWVMVIVGGAGNNKGAIIGAFLVYGMEWISVQLKDFVPDAFKNTIFYTRLMIIGVLLIVLIIYRPEGILREKRRVLA